MRIWIMGTQASLLILTAVFFRMFLLYRLPKRTFVFLWWAAAFRFLIPYSVETRWNLYTVLEKSSRSFGISSAITAQGLQETGKGGIERITRAAPAVTKAGAEGIQIPICLWLAGILVIGCVFLAIHIRFLLHARTSLPAENIGVKHWQAKHRCIRNVRIRTLDTISSPMTYGILRPVILLPSCMDMSDLEALTYVLEHEWIHIKRMDVGLKYLLAAALCIHWLNPVVWILFFLAQRDIELACDEKVVKTLHPQSREQYAMTLIRMEENRGMGSASNVCFSEKQLAGRLKAIMKMKSWTRSNVLGALMLVILPTVLFFTSPGVKGESLVLPSEMERGDTLGEQIALLSRTLVGKPYIYSGKNLLGGTDSAGFVRAVYQEAGILLPEDMAEVAEKGRDIPPEEAVPGSIVFYARDHVPDHVAISLGDGNVVHASNSRDGVKISAIGYREIWKVVDIPDDRK